MKIACKAEDLKAVSKIARKANLVKIHMLGGNFERSIDRHEKMTAVIDVGGELHKMSENEFVAQVHFDFKGLPHPDDQDAAIKVGGIFLFYYKLDDNKDISEEEINSFCEVNAVYNAWPYLREYLTATLARLDLPPFVMPLLKIGQSKQKSEDKSHTAIKEPVKKKKTGGQTSSKKGNQ